MKKLILVLLALGIVGTIVSGCSSAEETETPTDTSATPDE
jgi:Phr family secreted Rap phosphatase inhibitor